MAPDKIYLQVCGECPEEDCKNCKFEDLEDNVTWCKDRIYKKDVEYIRKDALMEWAKDWQDELDDSLGASMVHHVLNEVIKKIESI